MRQIPLRRCGLCSTGGTGRWTIPDLIRHGVDGGRRRPQHALERRPALAGMAAVLGVLEALDRLGPSGLAELSAATGLPKTTLHRACAAMQERGVRRAGRRRGLRARSARGRARHTQLVLGARLGLRGRGRGPARAPRRDDVPRGVLNERDALFIAKAETSQAVRLVTRVGSRLPAFAAASGRVLSAALEPGRGRSAAPRRRPGHPDKAALCAWTSCTRSWIAPAPTATPRT